MFDEIEKFIKKMAEAAEQAQRPPQPPPKARPKQKQQQPRKPRLAQPMEVEIVEPEIVDAELADTSTRLSQKVLGDLRGSDQISSHASRIGSHLDTDASIDAHVHKALDHKLGTLKQSTTTAPAATFDAQTISAVDLVKLLNSGAGLRNAIIMSELLRRPEENW
jgi:hypothetical protein